MDYLLIAMADILISNDVSLFSGEIKNIDSCPISMHVSVSLIGHLPINPFPKINFRLFQIERV